MQAVRKIMGITTQNQGFLRTRDLRERGISTSYIFRLVREGRLERVKRGVYRTAASDRSPYEAYLEVQKSIPQGVICLVSAAVYHGLSLANQAQVYVAVPNKIKVRKLDATPLRVFYLGERNYQSGIEEITIRGGAVRIYNKAKTVAQCLQFRNKIGMDITMETLKSYLKDPQNNISLLMKYARECRVEGLLRQYLEAIL
jgi:predicted transcriptional regulator of viral defense system